MFGTLFMFAVIKYLEGNIVIEKSEWDLQTVTASDYTIELKLRPEQISELQRQITSQNFRPQLAMGLRMKFLMIKEIESMLADLAGQQGYKVADINFAYQNSWLIDRLKERGKTIIW